LLVEIDMSDPSTLQPAVTQLYCKALPGRQRAIQAYQGQLTTLKWTYSDATGNPLDLGQYGSFDGSDLSGVGLTVKEDSLTTSTTQNIYKFSGAVSSSSLGSASFTLSVAMTQLPGIYQAEATVLDRNGNLVVVNEAALIINRTLQTAQKLQGPPTVAELRLALCDSDPSENLLLGALQFDLAQIAQAIEDPVLYWNESLPPINQVFDTSNFPFRYVWREAAIARLLVMIAHWYRRNTLPYSAGGTQINDLNKADDYEKIGQSKWKEFQDWVHRMKRRFNAEAAIQSAFSEYNWRQT
jgi:hypothetical protein